MIVAGAGVGVVFVGSHCVNIVVDVDVAVDDVCDDAVVCVGCVVYDVGIDVPGVPGVVVVGVVVVVF